MHGRLQSLAGDPQGRALVARLLSAACEPYFAMLQRWLCEGVLDDPYGEFMVLEDTVGGEAITTQRAVRRSDLVARLVVVLHGHVLILALDVLYAWCPVPIHI